MHYPAWADAQRRLATISIERMPLAWKLAEALIRLLAAIHKEDIETRIHVTQMGRMRPCRCVPWSVGHVSHSKLAEVFEKNQRMLSWCVIILFLTCLQVAARGVKPQAWTVLRIYV